MPKLGGGVEDDASPRPAALVIAKSARGRRGVPVLASVGQVEYRQGPEE